MRLGDAELVRWRRPRRGWEQDLKRLELGYEDEGFYNYKLQLGQADMAEECDQ